MAEKKAKSTSKGGTSKSKGLSANAQWALIGLVGAAILGVFDLSVLNDDDLDNRVRLADYAGTPTVVNFFAS